MLLLIGGELSWWVVLKVKAWEWCWGQLLSLWDLSWWWVVGSMIGADCHWCLLELVCQLPVG